jgi:hypothetical protein
MNLKYKQSLKFHSNIVYRIIVCYSNSHLLKDVGKYMLPVRMGNAIQGPGFVVLANILLV